MNRLGLGGATLVALAVALAGCTARFDLSSGAGRVVAQEDPAITAALRPVGRVERIEIGRTFDGFAITAFGEAPGSGWTLGRLRPTGAGAPGPDGVIEFEFVALPPTPGADGALPTDAVRAIRGYAFAPYDAVAAATGVRVIAAGNAVSQAF